MAIFAGKQWFRDNLAPFLTVIKGEICKHPPIIKDTQPIHVNTGTITHVVLKGDHFSPNVTVYLAFIFGTITNVNYIDFHTIEFDIFVGSDSTVDVLITTCEGEVHLAVEATTSTWVDLRTGSSSTWTETHDPGTNITYDAEGLTSSGSIWGNWYKFTSHTWLRSVPKKVSIIMKNSGSAHMAGIMSNEQDESSSSQYYQAEIYAYISTSYFWGFYGTNAAHAGASNNQGNTPLGSYLYWKIIFENNGEVGSTFNVYGLMNLSNLDDVTNLLKTGTVSSAMTADGTTLYVAATTNNDSRMVAFKVEDM